MPDAAPLAPLLLFALIATISPGGATTLATASGAQFGFRRSVPLLAGIALGLASLAAAAAAGLASVLLVVPALQWAMKAAGTAYLLWLAWKIVRSGGPNNAAGTAVAPTTLVGGACLLWLNPKGWAMALGAASSFAALDSSPVQLALLLGGVFGVAGALSLALWCAAGVVLARVLTTRWHWQVLNGVLGALLAASVLPMWW